MRKKFISAVVLSVLALTTIVSAASLQASTAPDMKVVINGVVQEFKDANGNKVEPVVINGTTYLPLRSVADAFGQEVSWDQSTSTITIGAASESGPVNLINVLSAKAMDPQWKIESRKVAKVSGEESLTFDNIGDIGVKYQTAVKIVEVDSAEKLGVYDLNGSYKTLSCSLLYIPGTKYGKSATLRITDADSGVDVVNQTLEPNKVVQISGADITGIKKMGFYGKSTDIKWDGTIYILNPIVQ